MAETLRQVMEVEPVPPTRLVGPVPRHLQTICLKCLQKEPARRYASAEALAADLGRFRSGEPIVARPVGRWERAVKCARRNPAVVGLLGAAAALLAGTTVSLYFALAAAHQAERARGSAADAGRKVEEIAGVVADHARRELPR